MAGDEEIRQGLVLRRPALNDAEQTMTVLASDDTTGKSLAALSGVLRPFLYFFPKDLPGTEYLRRKDVFYLLPLLVATGYLPSFLAS